MSPRTLLCVLALGALTLSTGCPRVSRPEPRPAPYALKPDAEIVRALAPLAAGFPVVAYVEPAAIDAFARRHDWAVAFSPEVFSGLERLEGLDRTRLMSVGMFAVDNRDVHAAAALGAPVGAFEQSHVTHHRAWLPSADPAALADEFAEQLASDSFSAPDAEYAAALGLPEDTIFVDDQPVVLTPRDDGLIVDVFFTDDESEPADLAASIAALRARPEVTPAVGPARAHFLSTRGAFGALASTFEVAVAARAIEPAARMRFFSRERLAARFPEELASEAASMRLLGVLRRGGERAIVGALDPTLTVSAVVERFEAHDAAPAASTLGGPGQNDLLRLRYVGPLGSREGAAWLRALPEDFGADGELVDELLDRPELLLASLSSPELLLAEVLEELAPGMREVDASAAVRGVAMTYSADDIESTGASGFAVDADPGDAGALVTWLDEVLDQEYGVAQDDPLRSVTASEDHPGLVQALYAVYPDAVFGAPVAQDPGLSIHLDVVKVLTVLEQVAPSFVAWGEELDVLHLSHDPSPRADTFTLVGGARGAFAPAPTPAPLPLPEIPGAAVAECFSEVPDLLAIDLGEGADIEAVRAFVAREAGATTERLQSQFACARERDPAAAELVETAWLYRLAAYHDALRQDAERDAILTAACPRRRVPACAKLDTPE
jgi:hypothetical protein